MSFKAAIRRTFEPIAGPLSRKWLLEMTSFAASGEDRLVLAWLQRIYGVDIPKIRYLDIGACHPRVLSNTFIFHQLGASGVLVEPDPDLCPVLAKIRTRDIVLNVGAAFDDQRSANLKRFNSRVFNTFSVKHAEGTAEYFKDSNQHEQIVDEINVPLVPVNDILARHFSDGLDFLSIDAEGVDLAILKSIDFSLFRPKMICVEASEDLEPILNPAGYEFVARTPDNTIFRLNQSLP